MTTPRPDDTVTEGPYSMLVVLRLVGPKIDGRDAARVAHAVRRAVMSRASEHLPALHGHHDGDTVQVAFLSLPFAGFPKADGHLLGVALALPDLPASEMAIVHDALPRPGQTMEVTAGPLGVLVLERLSPLEAQRETRTRWSLQPDRWRGPSRSWTTVTPLVLDRFLKRGDDLKDAIRLAVTNSRLPEPAVITVSRHPLLDGAPDLRPRDTLRRPEDRSVKPYRHVTLRFPEPVVGPVVVGSMRHYGLGLCVPVAEEVRRG